MNRKDPFMMAVALLPGTGLTTTLPGVSVQVAEAADGVQAAVTPGGESNAPRPVLSGRVDRQPGRPGDSRITRYVYNQYGEAAENVQLRISEVDASRRVVSSVTRPVFGTVPAEDRAYFAVQVPTSPAYQVAVQAFDFLQEPGK